MIWFRRADTQRVGWFVLALFLGFAAGNFHKTREALAGQSRWYQNWCGQQVKTRLIEHEQASGELP